MARSKAGNKTIQRVIRTRGPQKLLSSQPLQGGGGAILGVDSQGVITGNANAAYQFLDWKHPVYLAWLDRWMTNEARLAGGDDVIDELRRFEWETDQTPTGFYAKRQADAVYTNFPDIFATSITGHLLRFAPKPDQGWAVPSLGKVTGRSATPTQGEQVWYSVDNPSGAGSEWNQYWADVGKRAMATGHRWLYVDSTTEAAGNQRRNQLGYRPYLVEYSPIDTYNWYINERDVLEFVVFRLPQMGPTLQSGNMTETTVNQRGYLLCVRQGCTRLGAEFQGGGWWTFDYNRNVVDNAPWDDTAGEIPVSILYYQRHRGTSNIPAISRPGLTELGQAAIANMNLMSAANYNAWEAGGGVDYLLGIDDDAYIEAERLGRLGTRRIPIPPNSETDIVPSVSPSSLGAVEADIFAKREEAVWNAAVRIGIIEAAGSVGGSGSGASGATAEATFSAAQGPRIVWFATNLANCQNNIIRYFELRYGHKQPTGLTNWPSRFDLASLVDRIRSFFEIERLSGIRSGTAGATAMVMAAEDKGIVIDPGMKEQMMTEYKTSSDVVNKIQALQAVQANPPAPKNGTVGPPRNAKTSTRNANREALKKSTGQRRGPRQAPSAPPARSSKQ